jgi:hypothetical protein
VIPIAVAVVREHRVGPRVARAWPLVDSISVRHYLTMFDFGCYPGSRNRFGLVRERILRVGLIRCADVASSQGSRKCRVGHSDPLCSPQNKGAHGDGDRRWKPCFSPVLYRARNRIERFFNRIKHFRRYATRYEKHAANFLAMLKLAAVHLWLRHNESVT